MSFADVNISDRSIDEVIKVNGVYDSLKKISNSFKLLNVCVNGYKRKNLPKGYETYILGFWHEVFDEEWFLKQYTQNPNSMFIILGDFLPNDLSLYNRVKFVRILHWKYFIPTCCYTGINWEDKNFKISSLSHYVNEYRFFITAYLLGRTNVLFSYHNKFRNSTYLPEEEDGSTPIRDSLIPYREFLKTRRYIIDEFINDPTETYTQAISHPAYANSLVNSINETKDISYSDEFGICPGPYLTEKTWKPLYTGTALLFSSQMNTKKVLEDAGFNFNYGWDNSYSDLWQDSEKLEIILSTIDKVMGMSHKEIENSIRDSCEHNAIHIRSKNFRNYIDSTNQIAIETLNNINCD